MRINLIVFAVALLIAVPSIVNAQSAIPAQTVDLPGRPFGVVVSRDNHWIFVSLMAGRSGQEDGIAVLRNQEGQLKLFGIVAMRYAPAGIVLTHDGELLIAAAKDYVVFFDTHLLTTDPASSRLGWFHEGQGAGSIYVNVTSDDKTLFVSDESVATISVLDLAELRGHDFKYAALIGKIPVGGSPVALTFSPDQRLLYTTSEVAAPAWGWPRVLTQEHTKPGQQPRKVPEGAVVVVDVAKAKVDPESSVIARIPADGSPVRLALSMGGDRLFVTARHSNAVLVFDTARFRSDPLRSRIATIAVGTSPVPIALVDGDELAIVGNSNRYSTNADSPSTLSVLDVARIGTGRNPVFASVPAGAYPREFFLSSDGRTLFLTNFMSGTLQVLDVSSLPHPEELPGSP